MATALTETQGTTAWRRPGKHLFFRLDGEDYGFPVLKVQEIIQWTVVTRVPRMPDFVRGVINLRGKVVPVIDLHARFGLPPVSVTFTPNENVPAPPPSKAGVRKQVS